MRLKSAFWYGVYLAVITTGSLHSGEIVRRLRFLRSDLEIRTIGDYDIVTMKGCDISRDVGAPQLPVYTLQIALPGGMAFRSMRVIRAENEGVSRRIALYPSQPPVILSENRKGKIDFVPPKPEIYSLSELFPETVVKLLGTGRLGKHVIVSLQVYPLQYNPSSRALVFHPEIEVAVEYGLERESMHESPGLSFSKMMEAVAEGMTDNSIPDDGTELRMNKEMISDGEQYSYLIITSNDLVPAFEPLARWKNRKGLRTTIVTTETIYNTFSGVDRQEKIRNYIRYRWQTFGVEWVLLGGDYSIIPVRWAYAMDCEWGGSGDENRIPCDLYYADLDSNWDGNGNLVFGEVDDGVDLYPDVFVGRIPACSVTEVNGFVGKLLTYEQNPSLETLQTILFTAEILWDDPYTDSGIGKDMIEAAYLPDLFRPVIKLYQSMGNESVASVKNALNNGVHFFNHDGHAGYTGMGMGGESFNIQDADALSNSDHPFIIYSIGCWPGAFDRDCVGEHLVLNPNGGAVAFIGNSRYGWGSPGNPGYGYSDRFDQQFFRFIFQENIRHIGAALAAAKAFYAAHSRWENVYRWHQYQLNLLGDPEMEIWTEKPRSLVVAPDPVRESSEGTITLLVMEGGAGKGPVQNARVTLTTMNDDWVASSMTDYSGKVIFDSSHPLPDTVKVTAVSPNYLVGECLIIPDGNHQGTDGPHVIVEESQLRIRDGQGSDNGEINPGETVEIEITLKNRGNEVAAACSLFINISDPYVTLIDSVAIFGPILPDESKALPQDEGLAFFVDSTCPDMHVLSFHLEVKVDSLGSTSVVAAVVRAPSFDVVNWKIVSSGGDIAGLSPGDEVTLSLVIENTGGSKGLGRVIRFLPDAEFIDVDPDSQYMPDQVLESGDTLSVEFQLCVDPLCPEPSFPTLIIQSECEGAGRFSTFIFEDTLWLGIGRFGFHDDLEMVNGGWVHSGQSDLWNLSNRRAHSGDLSWYCGANDEGFYADNMDAILVTPPFVLPPDGELRFWQWNEVTTYGVDGLYIEVGDHRLEEDSDDWERLDFIGSGGALGLLTIGNEWIKETYDLSGFTSGDTVRIRFRFVSDGTNVAEGFYIDDIEVVSTSEPEIVQTTRVQLGGKKIDKFILYPNHPNPFNSSTTFRFVVPFKRVGSKSKAILTIYNVLGRPVRVWNIPIEKEGDYTVQWNGTNDEKVRLPSGVYICQVRIGELIHTLKMILME